MEVADAVRLEGGGQEGLGEAGLAGLGDGADVEESATVTAPEETTMDATWAESLETVKRNEEPAAASTTARRLTNSTRPSSTETDESETMGSCGWPGATVTVLSQPLTR